MKISLKIRAIAVVTVAMHLFTFSLPKAFADGIAFYDAQGNQVSQSDGTNTTANLIAGNTYHTNNADINIDQTLNVTVLNAQGLADATAKAIVEILGDHATTWAGTANIDGIVAFINEHGFDIAQSFQGNINGGAILSTLGIDQAQFFNGIAELTKGTVQDNAFINNNGNFSITKGSFLALVASAIQNQGNISANGGAVAFAVGDKVKLDLSGGSDLISVTVDKPIDSQVLDANGNVIKDGIANSGNIKADGGIVLLSASAKEQVFDNLINHSGIIEANTIANKGGQIILDGGDQGIVSVTGTLNAKGDDLGEKGGLVEVLGDKVGLYGGATVDVSGYSGGGTALIGGDYQGLGNLRTAAATYIDPFAVINADAILEGDGGKIIVWSENSTRAFGILSAKGGILSGDGGLIETSSKNFLDVEGLSADARAVNGNAGTWLIDPVDVNLIAGGANTNGSFSAGNPNVFTPTANSSTVGVDNINSRLNAGTNVKITTGLLGSVGSQSGNLTVSASLLKSLFAGPVTLTLEALANIVINSPIASTLGLLNVVLSAGQDILVSNSINTNGGNLDAAAGRNIQFPGAGLGSITTLGGDAIFTADSDLSGTGNFNMDRMASFINTDGGHLSISAVALNTDGSLDSGTGNVDITGKGDIKIGNLLNTNGGDVTITTVGAGDVAFDSGTADLTTNGGNILVNAVGTFSKTNGSQVISSGGNIDLTASKVDINDEFSSGSGDINITSTFSGSNGFKVGNKLTTTGGNIALNSKNGISIDTVNGDISTGGGNFVANTDTDNNGTGDYNQKNPGSSVNTAGGDVTITANDFELKGTHNSGTGTISLLAANPNTTIRVGSGGGSLDADISGTELQTLTGDNVIIGGNNASLVSARNISAANSNNIGTLHLNATGADGVVSFDNGGSTFNALDVNAGNGVTFNQDVTTDAGGMTINADSDSSGAGTFTVVAGKTLSTLGSDFLANSADTLVSGAINTGTGAVNGGNITINGTNLITIANTGTLNTTIGAGGILTAGGGVVINGIITLGAGNVTLNGSPALDLIINVPIVSATSIFLSALRDIIVNAGLTTTNAADGNITLRADSDDDGIGGVWIKGPGFLDAAQNVDIIGSDLFAIPVTNESIQVDADGVNNQILALGNIDLHTAGFAPAGSNMNINGIVKTTGVGKTLTIDSVGNINTSDDGVAELIAENLDLNAVTGIDAEIDGQNVSFNNTTSGAVSLEDMAGGLTVTGAANGGNGNTTIVTHSPLTIAADMIQNGAVILTAGETAGAGDDLTVNNGVTIRSNNDNVILKAGDDVVLGAGSTVESTSASVGITAGEGDVDGLGDINLAGAVNAFNNLVLAAAQGGIAQTTGALVGDNLLFSAENAVSLTSGSNQLATIDGSSANGSIDLVNGNVNTEITNLTTTGNDITYNHTGTGDVQITGTLDSGNGVDGGHITVNNLLGFLTVKSTAVLTSQTGVGGIFTASNVTIEGGSAINLGLGNITLNGGGLDLIINVPIVSAVSIFLTALRDIIVQAGITTTNAADGHITLRADSDNDGEGGVWLQNTGFINSADDVNILGSDLFAIPVTHESIQIDDNGSNQILAANDITLQTTGFAPAGSNMNLNGLVTSTGVGKTVTVKSVGNINTSDNGVAELVGDNVDLQAVTGIDAEINGKNLSYSNTTSGDVSVEDMAGGLMVIGASNTGGGTLTITTHSPLTVAADIIQAGTVNLNAGEVAGAGDDFTLNAGKTVRSTGSDVNINAGDDVDLQLGSSVESTTGAVNVNAGFGDLDGLGSISVASVSAATNAVLNAVGAIRGVTDDNVADVSGANVNLTAGAGGISGAGGAGALDVNVTTALAADTTNDNGDITIDSVSDLPLGLVNAGTGTVNLVSEGNMRDANDGGTPDAPAVTNIIGGTINLLAKVGGIGEVGNAVDFLASTQFNADTTVGSGGDDSNINVRSTGNAPIGLIDAGTGDVRLTSEGNITDANDGPTIATWDNPGILNIHGGRIDLETVNGDDIGEFVNYLEIGPSTAWGAQSHGGDIYIACIGPCPIDQVDLGTGTFYYTGNMVDFNDLLKGEDFGAIWNITAGGVHLDADNDVNGFIGSSTNWIETHLKDYGGVVDTPGRLVATAGTGGIHMSDDRDPLDLSIDTGLQIGGIAPATITNVTSTGDIELYSFSPILINASVNAIAGGNITLYALGGLSTDTMTVNANVQSSGGNGNIRMVSGGSMTMAPGTVISTQGDGITSGTGQIIIGAGYDATGKAADEPAVPGTTLSSPSSSLLDTVGDSSANVTMDETSRIWTEDGNILVDAQNNFIVGRVDADGNAGAGVTDGIRGNITTFSRNGSTLDAELPNEGNLDFVADTLTMFSGALIGIGSNPIELDAPNFNAFAIDSIFATAVSNVLIELTAVQGSIVLNGLRNILLGHASAGGSVSLGATDSILSQGGSDNRVTAGNNIQLVASGGVVGTASNPINTTLLSPGGTLYLGAGGSIDGLSTNVTGNFPSGQVQFLSTPPGLALFNGIAIGGELLSGFNSALSNIFVNPLPRMLPQFGQFDGRYTADFPGGFNLQQFGTPVPTSIDTTQLDTTQLPETVPPTVVPIPVPAAVPATTQEKKQEPKAVVPAQAKTVAQEEDQNPPAIVPIPTEAKPTSEKNTENQGNSTTVSGTNNR